jgi:GTP cyclohydrolase I
MEQLNHNDVMELALILSERMRANVGSLKKPIAIFPIPCGGIPAAYALRSVSPRIVIVLTPEEADCFVDDIIDSGSTVRKWCNDFPGKPFFALIDKTDPGSKWKNSWITWPWEGDNESLKDDSIVGTLTNRIKDAGAPFHANDNIARFVSSVEMDILQIEIEKRMQHLLRGMLIDVDNDHNTKGTAKRVANMYLREVFKGRYLESPVITDFPNAKNLDEMYSVGPISIRSACSHHFAPIIGHCWIGIIPGDRVIGLSKFNRIVDWIASRPQIQEEMSMQIANFIEDQIQPLGLAVVVQATHMCMTWRGVKEPMESKMTNSIMRGLFREKAEARAEFMALIK